MSSLISIVAEGAGVTGCTSQIDHQRGGPMGSSPVPVHALVVALQVRSECFALIATRR